MSVECGKCKQPIDYAKDSIKIICDSCRSHAHEGCAGLSATEKRCIPLQNRNLLYFCDNCRACIKSMPQLLKQIAEMNAEIKLLREELISWKSQPKVENLPENIVSEMEERISRAHNVIIYNVEESSSPELAQRIRNDKDSVTNLLSQVGVNCNVIKVVRLGKTRAPNGSKPRPLKLIFPDINTAKEVLRNKNKILNTVYRISNDFTPMQRDHMKQLRLELSNRISKGEQNLTIKYFRGVPKIISSKN